MDNTSKSQWKNILIKLCVVIGVIALDIVSKVVFFGKDIELIPGLISIRNAGGLNTGGAWGFLGEHLWVLIAVTVIFFVVVAVIENKLRISHPLYSIAMSFVVGGACGNFIDRIALGGVRDFLFFEFAPTFPTFNIADSFLCIGMALLLIYTFFVHKDNDEDKQN
ncbi:MAG: signal peptidase II [Christensenellales bacterium]